MSALDRKLGRDLWRLKGQVATIALVLACGILAMLMMRSTWQSLVVARDAYYAEYRFADVFARLQRAPDQIADRLLRLPGVAQVYPRVVEDVMVPIADQPDPVLGHIVSIPDDGVAPLNALYLRAGRLPSPEIADEIVINEQFAEAHHLAPGDRLPTVVNGQLRQLRIAGIGLSPEFVLAMTGGSGMVDNRGFVVIWMPRSQLAPAFRMEGAFNDVAIATEPGASMPDVLAAIDRELAAYGGFHATARDRQLSNWALSGELDNLRNLAIVIPSIFLAVAAFLVNVVISRLVFLERTQIAVLKALGYGDGRIALHYLALVALIVAIGGALGTVLGYGSGLWMANLYAGFYRFPTSIYHLSPALVLVTIAIGLGAAVLGALTAVRRVARMPPAEAMRPPSPLSYRRSLVERLGLSALLGPSGTMIVRELQRRPFRFLMSTAGIAMAVAIYLMGMFSWDSFDRLMDETYLREHREDLSVRLATAQPASVVSELAHLPGVVSAEGERAVAVRFHAGPRWRDGAIDGAPAESALRQLLDDGRVDVTLPTDGVLLTDRLADRLGVHAGDEVEVEVLEGSFPTRRLPVRGTIRETFGLMAHARADWLSGWLGEEPRVTTILLSVEPGRQDEVRDRLKELPAVVAVTSTDRMIDNYRRQTGDSMGFMTWLLALSAAAIAIGVVYNNARIALSMRSRDLASLRVLGFTRREISGVLLGELGVQVALGIPAGLMIGTWWSRAYAASIDQEYMHFPFYIAPSTYAAAATIALVSGVLSALLVRRKLDSLDLIAVLKSATD